MCETLGDRQARDDFEVVVKEPQRQRVLLTGKPSLTLGKSDDIVRADPIQIISLSPPTHTLS